MTILIAQVESIAKSHILLLGTLIMRMLTLIYDCVDYERSTLPIDTTTTWQWYEKHIKVISMAYLRAIMQLTIRD
jgi:hypothetical protein